MRLWKVFEIEELISCLEDVMVAIQVAQKSADHGDIANAIYNIDHAEINMQRARNLAVNIQHGPRRVAVRGEYDEVP